MVGRPKRQVRAENGDLSLITGHHRNVADQASQLNATVQINIRHLRIVRFENGCSRDVFCASVAIFGKNGQLLRSTGRDAPLLWKYVDRFNRRRI